MEEGSAAAALPSAAIAASMRMCFACGRVSEAHTGYIRQQGDARSLLVLDSCGEMEQAPQGVKRYNRDL